MFWFLYNKIMNKIFFIAQFKNVVTAFKEELRYNFTEQTIGFRL